jgi:MoxR-like ATPase
LLDLVARFLGQQASRDQRTVEQTMMAFAQLLPIFPQVFEMAMVYFKHAPCLFDWLTSCNPSALASPTADELTRTRSIARAAHDLLSFSPPHFTRMWNWSPFHVLSLSEDVYTRWHAGQAVTVVTGMATQQKVDFLRSLKLAEGDAASLAVSGGGGDGAGGEDEKKGGGAAGQAAQDLLRMEDLQRERWQRNELHAVRLFVLPSCGKTDCFASEMAGAPAALGSAGAAGVAARSAPLPLHPSLVSVCGVLLPKRTDGASGGAGADGDNGSAWKRLLNTTTATRNLHSLALALCQPQPVLLQGEAGSGKSSLLRELARVTGNTDMVEIQLDDQTDSKTLLGTYLCTEVPGEFLWQPGALTQAVRQGRWVVIEDIDRAPFELLAALGPLLEKRLLPLPSRGEDVVAAPGFQLFATLRLRGGRSAGGGAGGGECAAVGLQGLWAPVTIEPPTARELLLIVETRFPELPQALLWQMLRTFEALRDGQGGGDEAAGDDDEDDDDEDDDDDDEEEDVDMDSAETDKAPKKKKKNKKTKAAEKAVPKEESASVLEQRAAQGWFVRYRPLTSRALLQWASRVRDSCAQLRSIRNIDGDAGGRGSAPGMNQGQLLLQLPELTRMAVVAEAIDCFCAALPSPSQRLALAGLLGRWWKLQPERVREYCAARTPQLQVTPTEVKIGTAGVRQLSIPRLPPRLTAPGDGTGDGGGGAQKFAHTGHALRLMETVAACLRAEEPVLLVGETGCGKTSVVQHLADAARQRLLVLNLSIQSDGSELVGGFKPVEVRALAVPLLEEFVPLFGATFSATKNASFLAKIRKAFDTKEWRKFSLGLSRAMVMVESKSSWPATPPGEGGVSPRERWRRFGAMVERFERQRAKADTGLAFRFEEGELVRALREGHWVLLDELNLASPETLQRLAGLLDGTNGSIVLTERGDTMPVERHPAFRLFGAMNPATDVGKKDLPPALRSRFTEVYTDELLEIKDLQVVAKALLKDVPHAPVAVVVETYPELRKLAEGSVGGGGLQDGGGHKPHYSLRTFVRSLSAARTLAERGYTLPRSLFEGFSMNFATQLDHDGRALVEARLLATVGKGLGVGGSQGGAKNKSKGAAAAEAKAVAKGLSARPPCPVESVLPGQKVPEWEEVDSFWLRCGQLPRVDLAAPGAGREGSAESAPRFVLTPSATGNLRALVRAVAVGRFPILLQGPTSSGKTTLVEYLAKRLGHKCVRVNNHEHTELSEYMGQYTALEGEGGKLVFKPGVLVEAVRRGYWIILDELNLAPSDVLEALNRLLDDNRELRVAETQEVVRPHPDFVLFATQNPAGGAYGGRKMLSRAFRNRFLEVHVDGIPDHELQEILHLRTALPASYCQCLVKTLKELQQRRQSSSVFAGKYGFITVRDLLRWAKRKPQSYQALAHEGYMLLVERLRREEEKTVVREVIEACCKAPVDLGVLYGTGEAAGDEAIEVTRREIAGEAADKDLKLSGKAGRLEKKRLRYEAMVQEGYQEAEAAAKAEAEAQGETEASEGDEEEGDVDPLAEWWNEELDCNLGSPAQLEDITTALEVRASSGDKGEQDADVEVEEADAVAATGDEDGGSHDAGAGLGAVVSTDSLRRLWRLVGRCLQHAEPVLLVGETGCGKTTVCQLFSQLLQRPLHVVNCHQHTEAADLLGSLRPVRGKDQAAAQLAAAVCEHARAVADAFGAAKAPLPPQLEHPPLRLRHLLAAGPGGDPGSLPAGVVSALVEFHAQLRLELKQAKLALEGGTNEHLRGLSAQARTAHARYASLFEWADGPLVTSMVEGGLLLLDEISLAEDAVLERLNSVLEPSRSLLLAEKGSGSGEDGAAETTVAAPPWRLMATMNPGGDFGKRELSPALRNRFTEVWVPAVGSEADLRAIVQARLLLPPLEDKRVSAAQRARQQELRLGPLLLSFSGPILAFAVWFNKTNNSGTGSTDALMLTVRDMLAWADFLVARMQKVTALLCHFDADGTPCPEDVAVAAGAAGAAHDRALVERLLWSAFVHGAALVALDGLGLGTGLSGAGTAEKLRLQSFAELRNLLPKELAGLVDEVQQSDHASRLRLDMRAPVSQWTTAVPALALVAEGAEGEAAAADADAGELEFSIGGETGFSVPVPSGDARRQAVPELHFSLRAPTTLTNLMRLLRALQLRKPILLEGSPGVGKSSLVAALAAASRHKLVRINMSEQTDLADLLGADLPMPQTDDGEGGGGPRFAWCDGVLLQALRAGHWVLLDELNLAPQPVLEGLNAMLDHRQEVFIPELNRTFTCPSSFRVFAAQNPLAQGGGRKGLPKSFLNRFTKVFVHSLTHGDLLHIAAQQHPALTDVPKQPPAAARGAALELARASARAVEEGVVPTGSQLPALPRFITDSLLAADAHALLPAAPAPAALAAAPLPDPSAQLAQAPPVAGWLLERIVAFNQAVHHDTMVARAYGRAGAPWEWNLRDIDRWNELTVAASGGLSGVSWRPEDFVDCLYLQRMRTEADRKQVALRFKQVFGWEVNVVEQPLLELSPTHLHIGRAVLRLQDGSATDLGAGLPPVPRALLRPMEAVGLCVTRSWPVLLVGRSGSGKSTLLRLLAALTGRQLHEVPLSHSTDASDLLGCFEQVCVGHAGAGHVCCALCCAALRCAV